MSERTPPNQPRAWRIGNVEIGGPLVLAPLAGFTSPPMRFLCRRAGAHLVFTEMVSCHGLYQGNRKTRRLLEIWEQEHPVAVQIFGGDPEIMAAGVAEVQECGADIIDINMCCPVPKVIRSEGGAALMHDHGQAIEVARAVVDAADVPVTCKIRAGVKTNDAGYLELALRLQDVGVAAISVHARTVAQAYHGEADHEHTARLVEALDIPVIASGDVYSPRTPASLIEDTGCSGVMFARGAIGRPWVFAQAARVLRDEEPGVDPPPEQRLGLALCHAQLMAQYVGEVLAVHEMRGHLAWYTRGLPDSKRLRDRTNHVGSLGALVELFMEYAAHLHETGGRR